MAESEMLYTARQVTESLSCSPQMAGKYFQALEKITKTKIKTHGREGRQFDGPTRDVLLEARNIVRSNNGITVEDAVRRALRLSQEPLETEVWGSATEIDLERLKTLLSEAITEPLRDDLKDIRAELAELKQGRELVQSGNPAAQMENSAPVEGSAPASVEAGDRQHGILARAAIWIEQKFRGGNSG